MKFCYHGSNFRQKFQAVLGYAFRESDTRLSPPLFKNEGLRGIGYSASIGNLILAVKSVTISYLIHYENLLQNATDIITNSGSYFITKFDRSLFKNASAFLLQNARVLLQNAPDIINCDDFITNCESYYKMRRLLQIATVQTIR